MIVINELFNSLTHYPGIYRPTSKSLGNTEQEIIMLGMFSCYVGVAKEVRWVKVKVCPVQLPVMWSWSLRHNRFTLQNFDQ